MSYQDIVRPTAAKGTVRTLRQQEELPLLRDHLLRLDRESRHDRFHGFMDDGFIERYAANVQATAPSSLPISKAGRCEVLRNCIRPINPRIHSRRSLSVSSRACGGKASAVSCSEK